MVQYSGDTFSFGLIGRKPLFLHARFNVRFDFHLCPPSVRYGTYTLNAASQDENDAILDICVDRQPSHGDWRRCLYFLFFAGLAASEPSLDVRFDFHACSSPIENIVRKLASTSCPRLRGRRYSPLNNAIKIIESVSAITVMICSKSLLQSGVGTFVR